MNSKEIFGRKLIEGVRDRTLDHYQKISRAEMKAQADRALSDKIQSLTDSERELLQDVVCLIADLSLHNMMILFEHEPLSGWRIVHHSDGVDLADSSDGLCGELYSEEGWIARYSTLT